MATLSISVPATAYQQMDCTSTVGVDFFTFFFFDDSLVVGLNMECDESAMTGESMPRTKDKLNPFMLSGCTVSDGAGRMIVTSVGKNSEWGRTIAKLVIDPEITLMQRALGDMTELISWLGTAADETRGFLLID